jgi:hypothetical protein
MTTIPMAPTFDDFSFELLDLLSGEPICPLNTSIAEIAFEVRPGATAQRLAWATFVVPEGSLAAGYINEEALQLLRIVPYRLDEQALHGILANITRGYATDEDGLVYNAIEVEVVGTEFLLDSRHCYAYRSPGGGLRKTVHGIGVENGKADDLAKKLVRDTALPGTCDVDINGEPRDWEWGTLVVEADAGECAYDITLTVAKGRVGEAIASLARRWGFDYELRPDFSGGALAFVLRTKAPRGGKDRSVDNTEGNDPVLLNDFIAAMMPKGSRHRTLFPLVTALHSSDYREAVYNSGALARWGRWEGASEGRGADRLATEIRNLSPRDGTEFHLALNNLGASLRWLADFHVGDVVTVSNRRIGLEPVDKVIEAIRCTFPEGALVLEVQIGDPSPSFVEEGKDKNLSPSHGGGGGGGGGEIVGRALGLLDEAEEQVDFPEDVIGRIKVHDPDGNVVTVADDEESELRLGLSATGVTADTYGSENEIPQITVDEYGRITGIVGVGIDVPEGVALDANAATLLTLIGQLLGLQNQQANRVLAGPASGGAAAPTVRALVAADLPDSGVAAGTYGSTSQYAQVTVDAKGRVTGALARNLPTVITAHGDLSGLNLDHHTHYLLASGARNVAGVLRPDTNNTRDLGTSTVRWRNLFLVTLNVSGSASIAGNLAVTGTLEVG